MGEPHETAGIWTSGPEQRAEGKPLKKKSIAFWATLMAMAGIILSAAAVIFYRSSSTPSVYGYLARVDRIALWAASAATRRVFPGDRAAGPLAPVFFDLVLVLVTGLQAGLVGACVSWALHRGERRANGSQK